MELTVTMNYDGHELGTYSIDEFTYGELERQIEKDMNEYIGYQLEKHHTRLQILPCQIHAHRLPLADRISKQDQY